MKAIINNEAVLVMAIAVLIKVIIAARRFNRRGIGGLQHFSNFYAAMFMLLLERLLSWSANALAVWALFKILFT